MQVSSVGRQADEVRIEHANILLERGEVLYKPQPRSASVTTSMTSTPQPAVAAAKSAARTSISPLHVHVYREATDKDKDSRDSISSVGTAIRHNSGRNSAAGSARNSVAVDQVKTPRTSRGNEAVVAAMRALASSKIPRKSPSGSGSNTRRGSNSQLEPFRKEGSANRPTSRDSRDSRHSQHSQHSRAGSGEVRHITTLQGKRDSLGINTSPKSGVVSVVEVTGKGASVDDSESPH